MAWWGGGVVVTQEDPRPRRGDGSWLRARGDLSSPRALHLPPPSRLPPLWEPVPFSASHSPVQPSGSAQRAQNP